MKYVYTHRFNWAKLLSVTCLLHVQYVSGNIHLFVQCNAPMLTSSKLHNIYSSLHISIKHSEVQLTL